MVCSQYLNTENVKEARSKVWCPDGEHFFIITVGSEPQLPFIEFENDTLAQVSPCYILDYETNKPKPGRIGEIIFRSEDDFRAGIMSHEAVHCATSYCRLFEPESLEISENGEVNEYTQNNPDCWN
ncbi:MAG: hypothetical protein ABFC34_08115 [Methanobacterium sp.]